MSTEPLSRREREILDILFRLRGGSAAEVRAEMSEPPSDSAVRTILGLLCDKGHARRRKEGRKYLYAPGTSPGRAKRRALSHLVRTFFGGSKEDAFAYWIDEEAGQLSDEELDRLAERIQQARKSRRQK
ncbi:Penicillinase repressor [Planctomycetes bacterium Poly30]|uniref:Penicillinase repressor n=1 Tax=Saltatorellus ferox TaxID=2528018 RepID=A0A518EVQ3_9BACT|nr:Penicillinase repressor [Planctomycetes bacterium Poly30]